ncbi:ABC transporter ATP-binding protein [Kerstersia gyiorum]|jgi:branched-chain amino acid transport system ATP-binding protein|uniref:ABC transporter ATP-binding protein n=1 Tax=Kerstersia gyiorum TaxID=206506 RepID=UPI000FD9ECDA|nr:ABC transporter ATP-binding protein [Kerstersia gyiorum]AZV95207.1 ABC transporter ATP-binding protein [Bordetella sp. J329]MCO7640492.1 ABC transporter ATP-binding protein [Pseudomonas sp. S 311-6]MCH4271560.1 ABC transporter ATP-binding protein [Kerstersia gyiorum]MCI1229968.1 ABC transporter ATP-binding protein [Kerstersia gyiorum]MCP1631890.1 branched-chain amino acid transport system ATP-binding protein [Kerstersia gyiorum]
MNREPLLSCRGIHAGYGASQVLFDVGLDIHEKEVVTLLGRNGMGKSTTIKTIIGALKARQGELSFGGRQIGRMRPDAIARLGVAVVPEGRMCFPNLTVEEHLLAFADNRSGQRDGWNLERIYEVFPRLKERSRNLGGQLSGGEQQMLAIGRALSTNPRLLILDEATEGLAPVIREDIWRCLAMLRAAGQTILVVDKYVQRLLSLADRHIILERGRVAWQGTSAELDADRSLWKTYLGV